MATIKSSFEDATIPANMTSVMEFVFERVEEFGDSVALVDGVSGRSYTFAEVNALSRRIASALTRQGFKQKEVFGIVSPNVPEFVLMFCGIARMGGIISALNPLLSEDEMVHQMGEVQATLIVTAAPFAEKVLSTKRRLPHLRDVYVFGEADGCKPFESLLADDGGAFPDVKGTLGDTFVVPFSSGTTGLPKGVVIPNRTVMWNLSQLESHPDLLNTQAGERVLALLPYFHIYGMVVIMLHSLRVGATQVSMMRFEPEPFLRIIQDHRINIAFLVPPLVLFLAKHPLIDKYDLFSLRDVISGAAPLGGEIAAALKERIGVQCLRQGFGMTETGPVAMFCPASVNAPSSVGKLLPNTEAKVIDTQTGQILGEGDDGELWVRGPQLMDGYLNNPTATKNTIDDEGFLHTGDIAHYDDQGLFYIVDRIKELIKYKGFQVPPAELEALILTHPSVSDVAVIGIHDDEAGELPKAYLVRKDTGLTETDVSDFVAGKVAPHKKLRGGVEFVTSIPKSASGKILRRVLREQAMKAE